MLTNSRKKRHSGFEIWPGFVDALSTILMVVIFVLMTFVVAQLYLTDAISGKDEALSDISRRMEALTHSLEEANTQNQAYAKRTTELEQLLADLRQSLAGLTAELDNERSEKNKTLTANQTLSAQIGELQGQLQRLTAALDASESNVKNHELTISDLSAKLNQALLEKVEELKKVNEQLDTLRAENDKTKAESGIGAYRSEFFAKLKQAIGSRQDIRIVGDRFVFQSELFFAQASAELSQQGQQQLNQLAKALQDITAKIPQDLKWILRVDGHTDSVPIHTSHFQSNWELSAARAIAVVKYLTSKGIGAEHLAAAGFSEHHPLVKGGSPEDLARNRRIEFKLDQR